ncbi:MAG: hypothetical protein OXQ84_18680 [bacterium]|nr:hypothetical protein [bacterium]
MFHLIGQIVRIVKERTEAGYLPYQLSDIRMAITNITNIDRIEVISVPAGDLDVVGRYSRYEMQIAPYAAYEAVVKIEYSDILNDCWRRYVICKELCQALVHYPSAAVDNEEKLIQLCDELRSNQLNENVIKLAEPAFSELIANIAAQEILCPLDDRRMILARREAGEHIDDMEIAQAFRLPLAKIANLFESSYIDLVAHLLDSEQDG